MSQEKKLKIFADQQCSDDFYYSFCHAGRISSIECTACGRVHFNSEHRCYDGDEEEFARLKKQMEANPDKYIMQVGDDSIPYIEFGGKQIVTICPCNYARLIENILLNNQRDILEFFDRITKDKLETATSERGQIEKVKTNLKRHNQG